MDGFSLNEFTELEQRLLKLANDTMQKDTRKFLKKEAKKLAKKTLDKAKTKVKEDDGDYFKSIKSGKVYKFNGNLSCRSFSSSPHAHLIEHGHRIVDKNGVEHGFKEGEHVFEKASKEFESEYYNDCQNFLDDMLEKGL